MVTDVRRVSRWVICLSILFSVVLVPCIHSATLGPVVNTGLVGRFPRIVIDSEGDIHLCYFRDYVLIYNRQVNGVWQGELVVYGSDSVEARCYPDFDLDAAQNAHFVWTVGPLLIGPKYVKFNAATNSWSDLATFEYSPSGDPAYWKPAISVCPNGSVFIVVQRASDYLPNFLYWNWKPAGGVWQYPCSQNPAKHIFYGQPFPHRPAIDCGPNNLPITAFAHWDSTNLDIAVSQATSASPNVNWPASPVRPGNDWVGGIADGSEVFLDSNNHAHVIWMQWDAGYDYCELYYGYRNGTAHTSPWANTKSLYFQPYIIDDDVSPTPPGPRLAVNSMGDICVVYGSLYHSFAGNTRYMLKEVGQNWPAYTYPGNMPPLITNSTRQHFPDVAVDPTNQNFIVIWENDAPSVNEEGVIQYRRIMTVPLLDAPVLQSATFDNTNQKIYVQWVAPSDPYNIFNYFIVQRKFDSGKWSTVSTTTNTYYVDSDIWGYTTFSYRVIAMDDYNRPSPASIPMSVVLTAVPTLSFFGMVLLVGLLSLYMVRHFTHTQRSTRQINQQ